MIQSDTFNDEIISSMHNFVKKRANLTNKFTLLFILFNYLFIKLKISLYLQKF